MQRMYLKLLGVFFYVYKRILLDNKHDYNNIEVYFGRNILIWLVTLLSNLLHFSIVFFHNIKIS